MQVLIDKDGFVTSYALIGTLIDGVEVEDPEDSSHFEENYDAYQYAKGKLTHSKTKQKENVNKELVRQIKERREKECFPIINRGQLWYEMLTKEQVKELKKWYQAWLDAPKTLVIPESPEWLFS